MPVHMLTAQEAHTIAALSDIHTSTRSYAYEYACTRKHIHTNTTHTHTHTYKHIHTHADTPMHTYIHTYTCMHAYIHTYTHTVVHTYTRTHVLYICTHIHGCLHAHRLDYTDCIALHNNIEYTALFHDTDYSPLQSMTFHYSLTFLCIPLDSITFHYIPSYSATYIPLHPVPLHSTTVRCTGLHSDTAQYAFHVCVYVCHPFSQQDVCSYHYQYDCSY